MILRRLNEHVKAQNWVAVGLDFLIVVLGVFLGIQLGNWNEARIERQGERRVIERLRQEVPDIINARAEDRGFAAFRRTAMDSALRKLFDEGSEEEITPPECMAIALSHIYREPARRIPIVEEMVATGRVDILRQGEVKQALLAFLRAVTDADETQRAISIDIHQLALEHPDLIASGYAFDDAGDERSTRLRCNTEGMRNNQQFLNTLVSNHERFLVYYDVQFDVIDARLEALLAALEAE